MKNFQIKNNKNRHKMVCLQPFKRIYTIKKHLIHNLYIYIHVTNPTLAQHSPRAAIPPE